MRRFPVAGHNAPAIEALELTGRCAAAGNLSYYRPGEHVPAHPGLRRGLGTAGHPDRYARPPRTVRMAYQAVTFRERLHCKETWVVGADR